jgi:hypothetical protein
MPKIKKESSKEPLPKVHPSLEGFHYEINSFGELSSSIPIEKLNAFLNKNVDDKKLQTLKPEKKSKNK